MGSVTDNFLSPLIVISGVVHIGTASTLIISSHSVFCLLKRVNRKCDIKF